MTLIICKTKELIIHNQMASDLKSGNKGLDKVEVSFLKYKVEIWSGVLETDYL